MPLRGRVGNTVTRVLFATIYLEHNASAHFRPSGLGMALLPSKLGTEAMLFAVSYLAQRFLVFADTHSEYPPGYPGFRMFRRGGSWRLIGTRSPTS